MLKKEVAVGSSVSLAPASICILSTLSGQKPVKSCAISHILDLLNCHPTNLTRGLKSDQMK